METTFTIVLVIMLLLITLSVIGNVLVMLSVYSRSRESRTFFMMAKVSIAANDLGLSALYLIYLIKYSVDAHETYLAVGLFEGFLAFFNCTSIYNVCLLCLLRCYAIKYPQQYWQLSLKRQYCYIVNAWSFGLVLLVFFPLMYINMDIIPSYCWMLLATYVYIIPFLFTLGYAVAMLYAYFHETVYYAESNAVSDRRSQRSFVVTTSLVVLNHLLSFSPLIVYDYWSLYCWVEDRAQDIIIFSLVATVVVYLKGPLNVIIYTVSDDEFKGYVKAILMNVSLFVHRGNGRLRSRSNSQFAMSSPSHETET